MNFHPLRAAEKKERESVEDKVLGMEGLLVADIKDRSPVQEAGHVLVLRAAKCHCRGAFQNVVLPIYSRNDIIS